MDRPWADFGVFEKGLWDHGHRRMRLAEAVMAMRVSAHGREFCSQPRTKRQFFTIREGPFDHAPSRITAKPT